MRDNLPTVSIIIPCYDHSHYLGQALRSVLNQTYSSWEAIIVDDGSTDDTAAVAARFTDLRIQYFYQENQGLSAARNIGIRMAQGSLLAFLDADDEWTPSFLERCVESLRATAEVAGVYTFTHFINEDGVKLPRAGTIAVPPKAFRERILQGGFFPVHAALIRADVIEDVGLFDTKLTSLEDWDFWIRFSEKYRMCSISERLVCYRISEESMSTNAGRMHANRVAVLTKHFGPPTGEPMTWLPEKRRAYAFAYRTSAFGHMQQEQREIGRQLLIEAITIWPALLNRLDTYYQFACSRQPKGMQGEASNLNIEERRTVVVEFLDSIFSEKVAPGRMASRAYSNVWLALAMLSDQAGDWSQARSYLLRSVWAHPGSLFSNNTFRRLVKLFLGPCIVRTAGRVVQS